MSAFHEFMRRNKQVPVVHHTQCGMGFLANRGFRRGFAERSGLSDDVLAGRAITDPQATLRHNVDRLLVSPPATRRLVVSGHDLDLATGLIDTIVPAVGPQSATAGRA